ncbi:hypothetical protein EVAR_85743_1 [Eumeta japonica]|uniref:Uncharacterized protein n=1 Tax=Eumeta variegata TaxID=151549 RepID=A0A4C1ZFN1_EUMVA|nr:hypothetical protein EVAR_85743_1 [Eumeta japonica]
MVAQLSFERELSRWRARALDLYSGWDMRSRGYQSCVFALINSRISGGNFRRSEDAGTSRSLSSTTVLTWLVKTPMAVNLVCRRDVMGMLLRFGVSIFSSAVDTLFQLVILRKGIGLPPSGDGQPHHVLIEITEGMTASPKARGLLGRAGQPFWRREIDRDYDECTMARHSESTPVASIFVMVSDENHEFLFDVTTLSNLGRIPKSLSS